LLTSGWFSMTDAHNGKIHNDFQTGIPSQRIEGKKKRCLIGHLLIRKLRRKQSNICKLFIMFKWLILMMTCKSK